MPERWVPERILLGHLAGAGLSADVARSGDGLMLSGPGILGGPLACRLDRRGPCVSLLDEPQALAACGLMAIHGRGRGRRATRLGVDYVTTATGVVLAQGVLAGVLARLRGRPTGGVTVSMAARALFTVSQYLAAGTGASSRSTAASNRSRQTCGTRQAAAPCWTRRRALTCSCTTGHRAKPNSSTAERVGTITAMAAKRQGRVLTAPHRWLLPVLGLASAAYQVTSEARDARRYPPPGERVDIGGRRLHLWPAGTGAPSVIIVPALGSPGLEWRSVQQELAQDTSVYVYDRAGLGWSDPGPWPRTAAHMADELHQLLVTAAVPTPYLLVGHSVGGIIVRQFAVRHPGLLAGLVLVDSSHENQIQRLAPHRDGGRLTLWRRAARWQFKPLGIIRAASDLGITTQARRDAERESPPGMAKVSLALFRTSRHRRAVVQELIGFSFDTARGAPPELGELPLTVLTAGPDRREHWYAVWREMQHELAALSSRSVHLIAEHSGHHMQMDDPAFVIRAIRDALQRSP